MFVKAIKNAITFTKPFLTGKILYKDRQLINGINTVIVLNEEGDLLTCAHVADAFLIADDINDAFPPILKEIKSVKTSKIEKLEKQYNIKSDTIIAMHNILIDIAQKPGRLTIIKHEYLDLAIIKIENKDKIFVNNFPVFNTKITEIGTSICGLGFAFPEYDTFAYDYENEKIITTNKVMNFPIFPLNGIVTRLVANQNNEITLFETSMQVIPGQNGGPVLNEKGEVIGMLIGTKRFNSYMGENRSSFIDLGLSINSNTIVKFLEENNIKYNKAGEK